MQAEILLVEECEQVSFYTIQTFDDGGFRNVSEFSDFKIRMQNESKNKKQLRELDYFINKIKNEGAKEEYFRREGIANALPPHYYRFFDSDGINDFGLRLYCIRVSDEIVILLNGDRKITQNPAQCPNCSQHFANAKNVAMSFYDGLNVSREIEIKGKDILFEDDFLLNF